MCPEFEMIDRQVTNDVSLFEAQIPFNPPQGKLIIDPARAIKKFRRSAAGNYELAEDLRPPEVLLATTVYLMRDVLGDQQWPDNSVPFSVVYAFIRDRLRAIRTDLTLQSCKNLASIRIHELSIRFLIAAGHLLCEDERAAFEPQQNNEQLNGCLSALREMYKAVRLTSTNTSATVNGLLKYEAEFQAYSIILSVDKKEAAIAISSLSIDLLQNESIQVALEAYSAFQQTNYIKFMNIICLDPRTTYLQACLLHQFVLPVRQKALNAIISLPDDFKTIPKADFIRWLAFVDEDELFYYSERFGFKVTESQVNLSALTARGEVFDLRAEEENFKIRKFEDSIELKRRGNFSLSSLMFHGTDLNLASVMKVLQSHQVLKNGNLTSEFLAAASSPISKPTISHKKSFNTKSSLLSNSNSTEMPKFEMTQVPIPSTYPCPLISAPAQPIQPQIDHKEILRRKLEAQAQERQLRKERIEMASTSMLDALIDSVVRCAVAEICTISRDTIWKEEKESRNNLIQALSLSIFDDLFRIDVFPSILDVELMKVRCKAADSFSNRSHQIHQSTFSILSSLETEIYEETVKESLLEYKRRLFKKRSLFNLMRKTVKTTHSNWNDILNLPKHINQPVHLVFVGEHSSLIENILKTKPQNPLKYLQRTLFSKIHVEMIWSELGKFPFVLSHLKTENHHQLDLFNWPTNFPGPTVIITENDVPLNFAEFPWEPKVLKIENLQKFDLKTILISAINQSINLPNLNQNLTVSQLIPQDLIESFVNNEEEVVSCELLAVLLKGIVEKIIWILFKSPQASRLLSWHPITAGRSIVIDSIRKSQSIPETFMNLFQASESMQTTLNSLDQIYVSGFTCNLELLYTTQSISELLRTQNEIISNYNSRKRRKTKTMTQEQETPTPHSIDHLKEKLRMESLESEAYEHFLKKFL